MLETVLANIPLFSLMSQSDIADLADHAYPRIYSNNAIIIREGDISDSIYIVLSGTVNVFTNDEQGNEIQLNTLKQGAFFGELSLLDEETRSASAKAASKTMLAIITKTEFTKYLHKNPIIAIHLCVELSRRLRSATERLKKQTINNDYSKIIKTLLLLAQKDQQKLLIKQNMTDQQLASIAGTSCEMATQILNDLKKGGYVEAETQKKPLNEELSVD